MHFVLTYDIQATGDRRNSIEENLDQVIQEYAWVKPLPTTYIIQVYGQLDWNTILESLKAISRNNQGILNFVMTPLMQGGRYDGWLTQELWIEINKRSN